MEKYRKGQKNLHSFFVDLEKLSRARVPKADMYEGSVTMSAVEVTVAFKVEVGLHQGLALSPFLFVMD